MIFDGRFAGNDALQTYFLSLLAGAGGAFGADPADAIQTVTTAAGTGVATEWSGGQGTAFAQGTFGGGTLAFEASFDGGANWIAMTDVDGNPVTLSSEGIITFEIARCSLRGVLTGSAGATVEFAFLPIP